MTAQFHICGEGHPVVTTLADQFHTCGEGHAVVTTLAAQFHTCGVGHAVVTTLAAQFHTCWVGHAVVTTLRAQFHACWGGTCCRYDISCSASHMLGRDMLSLRHYMLSFTHVGWDMLVHSNMS